jgi:hypothetical protein
MVAFFVVDPVKIYPHFRDKFLLLLYLGGGFFDDYAKGACVS